MKVWIARDADGGLFMYDKKPKKGSALVKPWYLKPQVNIKDKK